MPRLQIELSAPSANTKITPIDIAISDKAASELALAITMVDQTDAVPGDGQIEETQHVKFPVDINLLFTHLKFKVDETVTATLRIKADTPATV